MALFPEATTPEAFREIRLDEARLLPGVLAIRDRHGMGAAEIVRFPEGSLPVYRIGAQSVLKLFPPCFFSERDHEGRALEVLSKRLPIATPGLDAVGELEGWGYLLMELIPGVISAGVWKDLDREDRLQIGASLGEALSALHAIRDPRFPSLPMDWLQFLASQRSGCVNRQRSLGLDERWLEQIPGFLENNQLEDAPAESPLHTEIMREHVLLERRSGKWAISGLIDFEPAMVGAPGYEFASVGLFFSCTEPGLLQSVLDGYGFAGERGAAMQQRFLAYALLHRYSNLPWYLERLQPPDGTRTLQDLAAWWWRL